MVRFSYFVIKKDKNINFWLIDNRTGLIKKCLNFCQNGLCLKSDMFEKCKIHNSNMTKLIYIIPPPPHISLLKQPKGVGGEMTYGSFAFVSHVYYLFFTKSCSYFLISFYIYLPFLSFCIINHISKDFLRAKRWENELNKEKKYEKYFAFRINEN